MSRFSLLVLAQLVSSIGTRLTGFGLGFWVYAQTGSATWYGLIALATILPQIVLAPLAGLLVDRVDRKRLLIAGHLLAGAGSLALLVFWLAGALQPWIVVALVMTSSAMTSAELVVVEASAASMVSEDALPRANGLVEGAHALAQIIAPIAAAWCLHEGGPGLILAVDITTFLAAVIAISTMKLPTPSSAALDPPAFSARELLTGARYIGARPGLVGLLVLVAFVVLNLGMLQVLIVPLALSFADEATLGAILSLGGVGMLLGAVAIVVHGGPRRLFVGIGASSAAMGLALFLAVLRPSVWILALGAFLVLFTSPIVFSCAAAIWQRVVEPGMLGQVLAARQAVTDGALCVGYVCAGPLAERVFEPLMHVDGAWAGSVGLVLGVGPGRGIALLLCGQAVLLLIAVAIAAAHRPTRCIEHTVG